MITRLFMAPALSVALLALAGTDDGALAAASARAAQASTTVQIAPGLRTAICADVAADTIDELNDIQTDNLMSADGLDPELQQTLDHLRIHLEVLEWEIPEDLDPNAVDQMSDSDLQSVVNDCVVEITDTLIRLRQVQAGL